MDSKTAQHYDNIQDPFEKSSENKQNGIGEIDEKSNNSDLLSEPLFSEPVEENSNVSKNSDTNESTMKIKKRRLGMTGPAFTKSTLSVNLSDVSQELNIPKEQSVVETSISEDKHVVRKYMYKKCPEMFFTKNGYERHLLRNHKITNVSEYEPEIFDKTIRIFGTDGYETLYRKVKPNQDRDKVKLVDYSCKDDNETSGSQNENINDKNFDLATERNESDNVQGEGEEIKAGPWTMKIPPVQREENSEEKTVHCTLCPESFFYQSGLNTHMQHAHPNQEGNADTIYANQIAKKSVVKHPTWKI